MRDREQIFNDCLVKHGSLTKEAVFEAMDEYARDNDYEKVTSLCAKYKLNFEYETDGNFFSITRGDKYIAAICPGTVFNVGENIWSKLLLHLAEVINTPSYGIK